MNINRGKKYIYQMGGKIDIKTSPGHPQPPPQKRKKRQLQRKLERRKFQKERVQKG